MDDKKLAQLYLKRDSLETEENWEAWVLVSRISRREPERGFCLVLEMLRLAQTRSEVYWVAAGPLETLLEYSLDRIKNKLVEELLDNDRLLYALTGVWVSEESGAESFVDNILEEAGPSRLERSRLLFT